MFKVLITLGIFVITTAVHAQYNQDYYENPEGTGIPIEEIERYLRTTHDHSQGDPFFGLPIRWPTYFDDSAMSMGGGMATTVNKQRVVVMSPKWVDMVGALVAGAALQHEYCHHDNSYSPISAVREADADCCAARHMARAGRTDGIWAVARYFGKDGCNYDPKLPIELTPASHPCGTQRENIVLRCGGLI
jgi:hypothetical protein